MARTKGRLDLSAYRGRDQIVSRVGRYPNDYETIIAISQETLDKTKFDNAEHLVACWNAIEDGGIADPSAIPDAIHALQKLVEWACEHVRKGDDWHMIEQIERTLTKLKGGA